MHRAGQRAPPAVGDEAMGRGRGIREHVVRDMVAVRMADYGPRSGLPGVEPEPLLGKVDATFPEDGVRDQRRLLLSRGRAALEELVAKRTVGAEPLTRRPGKNPGLAAGGAGLLGIGVEVGDGRGDFEEQRFFEGGIDDLRLVGRLDGSVAVGGRWNGVQR